MAVGRNVTDANRELALGAWPGTRKVIATKKEPTKAARATAY